MSDTPMTDEFWESLEKPFEYHEYHAVQERLCQFERELAEAHKRLHDARCNYVQGPDLLATCESCGCSFELDDGDDASDKCPECRESEVQAAGDCCNDTAYPIGQSHDYCECGSRRDFEVPPGTEQIYRCDCGRLVCHDTVPNASLERSAAADTLQDLVGRSVAEATENNSRVRHNAAAATEDMIPYDNTALCELVDAVDNVLTPNTAISADSADDGAVEHESEGI